MSTTLMVVLITTIVLGGLMSAFAKIIGLEKENLLAESIAPRFTHKDAGAHDPNTARKSVIFDKEKSLAKSWRNFDDKFIKPIFGGDLSYRKRKSAVAPGVLEESKSPAQMRFADLARKDE